MTSVLAKIMLLRQESWRNFVSNFTKVAPWAFGLFGNQCKNPDKMVDKLKVSHISGLP